MSYQVLVSNRAKRDQRRLPDSEVRRVAAALKLLEDEPYPRGALKLTGVLPPMWRLRIGEYRVMYSVSDEQQVVLIESVRRRTTRTYD